MLENRCVTVKFCIDLGQELVWVSRELDGDVQPLSQQADKNQITRHFKEHVPILSHTSQIYATNFSSKTEVLQSLLAVTGRQYSICFLPSRIKTCHLFPAEVIE